MSGIGRYERRGARLSVQMESSQEPHHMKMDKEDALSSHMNEVQTLNIRTHVKLIRDLVVKLS